ncbi:unnamed protein product [Pseudo-nitzschia multistriata]|uniref:Dimethylmenaquinone methyltransferase n=1 Tax=Pseudo-nitzschia multistriata TaxID=183589 RepID=A0A448ZBI6_9STRA|nr:unnamed protein product [Pseudo-nitzschia multistriata]
MAMMANPIAARLTTKTVQHLAKATATTAVTTAVSNRIVTNIRTSSAARIHNRPIHSESTTSSVKLLLRDLRELDTSSLCDAHKTITTGRTDDDGRDAVQIKLMNSTIRPMNQPNRFGTGTQDVMVGVARTVAFTEPDDFLPVMRALALEAKADEVLVVNTLSSKRAVAGEIFAAEARRKGLAGIVIDGPVRDTAYLDGTSDGCGHGEASAGGDGIPASVAPVAMRIYSTGTTPYSGTTQSPGEMQPSVVTCGGIEVRPGDIVVGDNDGVIVGAPEAFFELVPVAQTIQRIEQELVEGITTVGRSQSLASMTNLENHVRDRLEGKPSNLEFRT